MGRQSIYWKALTRKKNLVNDSEDDTKLCRVLGLFDLTALGVGSTLGAGVYVLAGQIAKVQAGPSVMISFAIAALASALAGICYAEFGARVPKAGSAYVYSYVCIGELAAFIIGWNLILEYVVGTSGVCRGISLYLDTIFNDTLKTSFADILPLQPGFIADYFDLLAFSLAVVFGVATAFGVEASAMFNNVCTILNISVLLFVIIVGSFRADIKNWQIEPLNNSTIVPTNIGTGGYFPFGFEGTLKGAATCFFGFVGFDCIATTGEEVHNPKKNIPRSIIYSLLIIFLCYFGISTVLTLMIPYYDQDPNAPLPYAFKEVGWNFATWIVTIGGLIGLLARLSFQFTLLKYVYNVLISLLGALFPIPRILYSMAEDGLIFYYLGKVSSRFKSPVVGSICAAVFTGFLAGFFDLSQLVNLLSIGTLVAYTIVAVCITILRYMHTDNVDAINNIFDHATENTGLTTNESTITFKDILFQLFNLRRLSSPNSLTSKIVGSSILFFGLICFLCGHLITDASDSIKNREPWHFSIFIILILLMILSLVVICFQPKERPKQIFRVPLVPLVPAISIFINIYLMLQLDYMTWIRYGIWIFLGLVLYCCYGLPNSLKQMKRQVNGWRKLYCS